MSLSKESGPISMQTLLSRLGEPKPRGKEKIRLYIYPGDIDEVTRQWKRFPNSENEIVCSKCITPGTFVSINPNLPYITHEEL